MSGIISLDNHFYMKPVFTNDNKSESGQYNLTDLKRILRTLFGTVCISVGVAVLAALPQFQDWAFSVVENNQKIATFLVPFMMALITTFFDSARRFLTDYTKNG